MIRSIDFYWVERVLRAIFDLEFLQVCLTYLFNCIRFLLLIYLCYAMGNLFPRTPLTCWYHTFVILGVCDTSLLNLPSILVYTFGAISIMDAFYYGMNYQTITLLYTLIMNVALFATNVYILRYHLNLE